jgi:hypothetical protein
VASIELAIFCYGNSLRAELFSPMYCAVHFKEKDLYEAIISYQKEN